MKQPDIQMHPWYATEGFRFVDLKLYTEGITIAWCLFEKDQKYSLGAIMLDSEVHMVAPPETLLGNIAGPYRTSGALLKLLGEVYSPISSTTFRKFVAQVKEKLI